MLPAAAKHRDAYLADESKSIKPESAGSWKLIAFASTCSGSFLPTGIYGFPSLTILTEILRWRSE